MKALNTFLVLSALLIIGCGDASPDAHTEAEEPNATATPHSTPADESGSVERDRATFALPPGNTGASQPSGASGAGAGAGTPATTHRHDMQ
jgi:hypothetical protein